MESRLGSSFADVRVHTGAQADQAAAGVQAEAFTVGSHLVFQHGRYQTGSAAGKEMLAHELTHVLQQRSGPVAGTDAGDGLAVSDPSDRFERAAAANARAVMRGTAVAQRDRQVDQEPDRQPDPRITVQRNVGVEVEESSWRSLDQAGNWLRKGELLIDRDLFELQAETVGSESNIELVTDPPGTANDSEWNRMLAGMTRLEQELLAQKPPGRQPTAGSEDPAEVAFGPNGELRFPVSRLEGGVAGPWLQSSNTWRPHLQMTAGIPLARVPDFFDRLKQVTGVTVQTRNTPADLETRLRDVLQIPSPTQAPVREGAQDSPPPQYQMPSAELMGFIRLLNHYLWLGANAKQAQFPKAIFHVMARTDFARIFSLIDEAERTAIGQQLEAWMQLIVDSFTPGTDDPAGSRLDQPVINAEIQEGPNNNLAKIDTSRRQWLGGMTSDHGSVDLLSAHGRAGTGDDAARRAGLAAGVRLGTPGSTGEIAWRNVANESLEELTALFQGLGGLGMRTDSVDPAPVTAAPADSQTSQLSPQTQPARGVVLEIRGIGQVARGPGGWVAQAQAVYDAITAAISGRDPERPASPPPVSPVAAAPRRPRFQAGTELVGKAKALGTKIRQWAVTQLDKLKRLIGARG